ncbi:diaminobutyrate--2-oxoglutarate aminotransferase [Paenibacillus terrae HPL-003]|uniref:Diaminobutyrate--2-oxoglutarate aminotransferase n=1 Tax=Paenibacillus terrae (strain HPL-003) TaxID=985665 RepID=G7W302_PAETH|nr:diaminobutyrate--2-oxoglutarate aminotransferase [Paenibacillus terrae HPL-003]
MKMIINIKGVIELPKATTAISHSTRYLESQAARESNARSYLRRIPIAIAEAEGIHVKDTGGRHSAVMRFLPSLIVTERQIDDTFLIFNEEVHVAYAGLQHGHG